MNYDGDSRQTPTQTRRYVYDFHKVLQDTDDANLYRYVTNDPVNAIDPSRLEEGCGRFEPDKLCHIRKAPEAKLR